MFVLLAVLARHVLRVAPLLVTQWLQCQPILSLWGPPMCGKTTICKYALILTGLDNVQMINQGTEAGLTAAASQVLPKAS